MGEQYTKLTFIIDAFVSFMLKYEIPITTLLMLFILLLCYSFGKESSLLNLTDNYINNILSRLSYTSISNYDFLVTAALMVNNYQSTMNIIDLIIISLWNTIFIYLVSLVLVVLFEIPLKIMAVKLRKYTIKEGGGTLY